MYPICHLSLPPASPPPSLPPASAQNSIQNNNNLVDDNFFDGGKGSPDSWFLARGRQPQLTPFKKNCGEDPAIAAHLSDGSPSDFFMVVVDETIFTKIADKTNLYATQMLEQDLDVPVSSR